MKSAFFILEIISKIIFFNWSIAQIESISEIKNSTELEVINGTDNFRIFSKNGPDEKTWFDGRGDIRHVHCVRPAKCEKLKVSSCFGSKIPYSFTSLDLTNSNKQEETQKRLVNYQALKHIPRCWAVVQPLICAVFVPKCEKINDVDMVYLPSLEMCKITVEPCKILSKTMYFPEFLQCNETVFPSKCNNDVREMKFNSTGICLAPLVPAESISSFYSGIEGCGMKCEDPLYTRDEHRQIHKLISWGAALCFMSNLFVVVTFFIDWKNANKYPAVIVFYVNLCYLISCIGWLAQFTPGSREDIVCKKDGTLRHSEPSAGENLSCIVIFVLVYYFLTAAMIWFVFLTYAWNLQAVGKDRIDKKGSYFHLIAWSLPLVLTITTMAFSEVDGNSITGVCFVGYVNHTFRVALLLAPLCSVVIIGGSFIVLGTVKLFGRKIYLHNIRSTSASNKIRLIILRMGICAIFTFVFILVVIICHVSEFRNSKDWSTSLKQYIICKILSSYTANHETCTLHNRPSLAMLQLHLLCLFGSGIVMSSWCWTSSSIDTWRRYINQKLNNEIIDEVKIQKHKVIAQTWAKRKDFDDQGRLSITLYNTFTDPVGLNFDINDLNSTETNGISSTWANYLPLFVKRRLALTGGTTNSSSQGPRKSSVDSEFSFSVRHVSVESRRNSADSQVSVKIAEMKTKVASRTRAISKHSKVRNRRREYFASSRKYTNRRESSTSLESQVIAMKKILPNHKIGNFTGATAANKNLKRRSAHILDETYFKRVISRNGQTFIPFTQSQGLASTSEEDNSQASFKVEDSLLNIILRQNERREIKVSCNKINEFHSDNELAKNQYGLQDILNRIETSSSLSNIMNWNCKENNVSTASLKNKSRLSKKSASNTFRIDPNNEVNMESKIGISEYYSDINASFTSVLSGCQIPRSLSVYSGLLSKRNSRNVKSSCDVGIQTNALEFVSKIISKREADFNTLEVIQNDGKDIELRRKNNGEKGICCKTNITSGSVECNEENEKHHLLPMVTNTCLVDVTDLEKLKLQMLLLPSKLDAEE